MLSQLREWPFYGTECFLGLGRGTIHGTRQHLNFFFEEFALEVLACLYVKSSQKKTYMFDRQATFIV